MYVQLERSGSDKKNKINSCNTDYTTYACENSKLTIPTVDITEIINLTLNFI